MSDHSRVSVTIHAGPIVATENRAALAGRQVRINDTSHIYFTPEIAAQWLPVIKSIAEEK